MRPAAIVLSPGPCTPREAGASLDIVRELHADVPMLGVCLGHQVIAEALGGTNRAGRRARAWPDVASRCTMAAVVRRHCRRR